MTSKGSKMLRFTYKLGKLKDKLKILNKDSFVTLTEKITTLEAELAKVEEAFQSPH